MKLLASVITYSVSSLAIFALPNYDPFVDATGSAGTAYAVGNWLSKNDAGTVGTGQKDATGAQWFHAGNSANNSPTIANGNVGYPGLASGGTNMIVVGNNTATDLATGRYFHTSMNKPVNNGATAGSRFYSFVMQASDLTGINTTGGTIAWLAGFNNSAGVTQAGVPTVIGGRTIVKGVGAGYQIGLCKGVDTPNFYTIQTFTTSDKVFVVVEYVANSASTSDDVVNMWINPNFSTFGNNANKPAALLSQGSGSADIANGANGSSIQSFLIGNKASIGLYNVDELRVAADWAGVTPALLTSTPTNLTRDYGQSALFSVATATPATYQWQRNGSDLPGETASTLNLASVSQADEANYTVAVTGGNGALTSSVATLTVIDPKITSGPTPSSQSLPPGGNASFSVSAIGTSALTYRWKKDGADVADGNFGGTIIAGSATANLTINGVRPGGAGDSGNYTVGVTNGNGRGLLSTTATLTVVDPAIVTQPQSQTKNFGQSVTFSASVSGSSPPFTYVWRKNGSPVTVDGVHIVQTNSGVTSTLTINSLTAADEASTPGYTVLVTDSAIQSTLSSAATLTILDPVITSQVASVITNAGSTSTFKVQASGSGSVTYAWKTNGVAVANGPTGSGSTISGATTDTLTIAGVTAADANTYVVEVSGAALTQSSTGSLSVVTITMQPTPAALVIATNTRAVFLAGASVAGPGSLTYQWRKTSGNIGGETGTSLTLPSVQLSDSDSYTFRVNYGAGAFVDSTPAVLTVSSVALLLQKTNLVIARIGDGLQILRDAGNSIYLDQFTPGGAYVNTVTIAESGTNALVARGGTGANINSLGGVTALTLSADGASLVLNAYQTNYDAAYTVVLGSGSVQDQAIARAVTTINRSSEYSIRIQDFTANMGGSAFRCAAFDGVDEYYGATGNGTIGVYYFGTQVAAGPVTFNNARIVAFFNGQFYVSGANLGLFHFDGKPHPGDFFTQDITYSVVGGSGGCDFAVSPDGNTIYVADGRTWSSTLANTTGGIQKWEKVLGSFGSSPTRVLKPNPNGTEGTLYLTADFSQANPVVYATTCNASQNLLVKVVDDGSNSGAGTATVMATAGTNQHLRGIRFGPGIPAPVLSTTLPGAGSGSVTVTWTSVSGLTYRLDYKDSLTASVWTPISTNVAAGATTSYTDTTTPSPTARFYRVVMP